MLPVAGSPRAADGPRQEESGAGGKLRVLEPLPAEAPPVEDLLGQTILEDRLPGVSAPPVAAPLDAEAPAAQILRAVESWAEAWSSQDVERYLSFYAQSFVPPGDATREAWEAERRQRLSRPEFIAVKVSSPSPPAAVGPGQYRISFRQDYASDGYSDVVKKTLELVRQDGGFKIVREETEDWW